MFKTKTVDSIVAVFTKAIEELKAVEAERNVKIDRCHQVIAMAQNHMSTHEDEIKRAIAVRTKLEALTEAN